MTAGLFDYPEKTVFGRVLPKNKIYVHASPGAKLRNLFVSQIGQIVWRNKLAPETVRLAPRPTVPEIQVFQISLKREELHEDVLRAIDKAIPFPILFELTYGDRVKAIATYKRPNEADPSKWVIADYFCSEWQPANAQRQPLPVALDLAGLYEQMIRTLIAQPARRGDALKEQVERLSHIRSMKAEYAKVESRLRNAKQFNRKVELNAKMRSIKNDIDQMTKVNM